MLIGICGGICAGKHSVLSYLVQSHNFQVLALRPNISDLDEKRCNPNSNLTLPERHLPSGSTTFNSITDLLDHATEHWQTDFVTTSISTESDVEILSRRPFFILVHIDAPISLRYQRFHTRHTLTNTPTLPPTLESFVRATDTQHTTLSTLSSHAKIKILNTSPTLTDLSTALQILNLPSKTRLRPTWDHYFMTLANLAARRSNCMRRQVGCVLVRKNRILATGYNGTPLHLRNCAEGGCPRCNNPAQSLGGAALSTCLCIHAEENALLEAGRERVGDGAVLYCNTCPCLTCTIKIVQVGIGEVVFSQSYYMDAEAAEIFKQAGVKLRQFSPPREGLVNLMGEESVGDMTGLPNGS